MSIYLYAYSNVIRSLRYVFLHAEFGDGEGVEDVTFDICTTPLAVDYNYVPIPRTEVLLGPSFVSICTCIT